MRNTPPIRLIDDPPWRDDGRDEAFSCKKCERAHDRGETDWTLDTEPTPDGPTKGYCDEHGRHDEFHWISV